jgi:hypothetical protein
VGVVTNSAASRSPHRPGRWRPGAFGSLRPGGRVIPGTWPGRIGHWVGSWAFAAVTVVLVVVATVLTDRYGGGSPLAVLGVILTGLVLAELPLLFMLVGHADRTATELALHQLESDKQMAAQIGELADNEARLAVELARLNARLRASRRQGPDNEERS